MFGVCMVRFMNATAIFRAFMTRCPSTQLVVAFHSVGFASLQYALCSSMVLRLPS